MVKGVNTIQALFSFTFHKSVIPIQFFNLVSTGYEVSPKVEVRFFVARGDMRVELISHPCTQTEIILAVALAEWKCSWCQRDLSQRGSKRVVSASGRRLPFSPGCLISFSSRDLDNGVLFGEHCLMEGIL